MGLLVPPEDVAAFAAALSRLMGDAVLRAALAERAWQRAKTYAPERIAELWCALVEEVCAEASAGKPRSRLAGR